MILEKLDIQMKNERNYIPISKWIKSVKISPETMKPPEENRGEILQNIGIGKNSLDMSLKAQETKEKQTNKQNPTYRLTPN
jgi:hypothetical protein